MKKLLILVIVSIVLVGYLTTGSKLCGKCRVNHRSIRYIRDIDMLNYQLYKKIKCPTCLRARSVKYF